MRYVLAIHKDPNSCYGVTVPDLPGCFSAGDTLDEAIEQAREAILLHLESSAADGEELPAHRSVEEHRVDPDLADAAYWAVVEVPDHDLPGKAQRINITMNERVLNRLDAVAEAEGQTRSGLLQRLASEYASARQSRVASARPVKPAKKSKPAASRSTAKGRKVSPRR